MAKEVDMSISDVIDLDAVLMQFIKDYHKKTVLNDGTERKEEDLH